jgi:hypothetical protein
MTALNLGIGYTMPVCGDPDTNHSLNTRLARKGRIERDVGRRYPGQG